MPFPIRQLQCDNGTEFPLDFALTVQAAGIRHRYITPRRPEQNGKVEHSHRIDDEEFGSGIRLRRSTTPPLRSRLGSGATTTSASRWRFAATRRVRRSPRSSQPGINSRQPGSALDEVKQPSRRRSRAFLFNPQGTDDRALDQFHESANAALTRLTKQAANRGFRLIPFLSF